MKFRILTAVVISMITAFSVSAAAKADKANVYQTGITADGKYYDAETDSYLSGFIFVQNGVAKPMTAEQYLDSQAEDSAVLERNSFTPALIPFQKYSITSSGPFFVDKSYTYVVSAMGGEGITISPSFTQSISTTFQAGFNASYQAILLDGITAGGGGGISHNTTTEISNKYSNTVSLKYGRICFQPIRKVFTGDIEQWSFITLNRPPIFGKTILKNVKAYVPATYQVDSSQCSDGVYFLVERNTEFYESTLNAQGEMDLLCSSHG